MRIITLSIVAAASLLAAGASAGQGTVARGGARIPDGRYSCQMWMGNSYVTLAGKLVAGKARVDALTKSGATITGVTPAKDGIRIDYTTRRGYAETMDCTRA